MKKTPTDAVVDISCAVFFLWTLVGRGGLVSVMVCGAVRHRHDFLFHKHS
jgi:hypothetical protein